MLVRWSRIGRDPPPLSPSHPLMVGTGIFFSNAIFCTKFGTALKSKLNELKLYVKRGICISSDKAIAIQTLDFAAMVIDAVAHKKL